MLNFSTAFNTLKMMYAGAQTFAGYAPVIVSGVESVAKQFPNLVTEAEKLRDDLSKLVSDGEKLIHGAGSIDDVEKDGAELLEDAEALFDNVKGGFNLVSSVVANAHTLPSTGGLASAFSGVEKLFGIGK